MTEILPVNYRDDKLIFLDQTLIPNEEKYYEVKTAYDVWDGIKKLRVRGAPAIGVAAGYGMYITARDFKGDSIESLGEEFLRTRDYLITARPTAVNLKWAADRMYDKFVSLRGKYSDITEIKKQLFEEAEAIRLEDENSCLAMGELGLSLLEPRMGLLTHCNAGILATSKYGTCLSPVYLGNKNGYNFRVFADETRPLLQGARLTSWELYRSGVDVTLICDNMSALVMKKGLIDAVLVGCDRMAANGDGANKIGTSAVAILAKEYGIPVYMYAPLSTIDISTPTGEDIVIEERDGEEIYKMWYEKPMAPEGIKTFNPAFDVTDNKYITAVITEKGIARPPYSQSLAKLFTEEK